MIKAIKDNLSTLIPKIVVHPPNIYERKDDRDIVNSEVTLFVSNVKKVPLQGVEVYVPKLYGDTAIGLTDEDGRATVTVPFGKYTFLLKKDGFIDNKSVHMVNEAKMYFEIIMVKNSVRNISLECFDSQGQAINDYTVRLHGDNDYEAYCNPDEDEVVFDSVLGGEYDVTIISQATDIYKGTVDITVDNQHISCSSNVSQVTVHLTDDEETDYSGLTVKLDDNSEKTTTYSAITDNTNIASFKNCLHGSYKVTIYDTSVSPVQVVYVEPNIIIDAEHTQIEVIILKGVENVIVECFDSQDHLISDYTVKLDGDKDYEAICDSESTNAVFDFVKFGTYNMSVISMPDGMEIYYEEALVVNNETQRITRYPNVSDVLINVTDDTEEECSNLTVNLVADNHPEIEYNVLTNETGSASLKKCLHGTYELKIFDSRYPDVILYTKSDVVIDADNRQIDVILQNIIRNIGIQCFDSQGQAISDYTVRLDGDNDYEAVCGSESVGVTFDMVKKGHYDVSVVSDGITIYNESVNITTSYQSISCHCEVSEVVIHVTDEGESIYSGLTVKLEENTEKATYSVLTDESSYASIRKCLHGTYDLKVIDTQVGSEAVIYNESNVIIDATHKHIEVVLTTP